MDFKESDAEFYKSMNWLLENDVVDLEMSFVYSSMVNGKVSDLTLSSIVSVALQLAEQELVPGGESQMVTEANKAEFIDLMCQKKAIRGVEKPLEILLTSFNQVLLTENKEIFQNF